MNSCPIPSRQPKKGEHGPDAVPAKVMHDYLKEELDVEPEMLSDEKVLRISSLKVSSNAATEMRYAGRLLSEYRNMPFGYHSNISGGAHCGFFFERCQKFDVLREWIDGEESDSNDKVEYEKGFRLWLSLMMEMDPNEEYTLYWFS